MTINVGFALNLPNQKAIDYFVNKSIVPASKIHELGDSAHARAYTNAGVNNLNLLQDFKSSLDKAIKEGKGFNTWRNEILDTAKSKGWLHRVAGDKDNPTKIDIVDVETGQVIPAYRLKTIYNTNMNAAFQAARYQQQLENAIYTPHWEYVAVGDERTRPLHAELNGSIYPYDDGFWQIYYPPNGYNCRCIVVARSDYYMTQNNRTATNSNIETDEYGDYVKPFNQKIRPDKGFGINNNRHGFRPNLDNYDATLARQFAERDLSSPEFRARYESLQKALSKEANAVQTQANRTSVLFTAGVLPELAASRQAMRTVSINDAALVRSITDQSKTAIGFADYAQLPALLSNPDAIGFIDAMDDIVITDSNYYAIIKITSKGELILKSLKKTVSGDLEKIVPVKRFR